MIDKEFQNMLDKEHDVLVKHIVSDITRHVSKLYSSGRNFYGYAILPSDYYYIWCG